MTLEQISKKALDAGATRVGYSTRQGKNIWLSIMEN